MSITDEDFIALLNKTANTLGWTDKDIGHYINVSLTTVGRWRQGRSSPHAAMRRLVVEALQEALQGKV